MNCAAKRKGLSPFLGLTAVMVLTNDHYKPAFDAAQQSFHYATRQPSAAAILTMFDS